ncbi:MAG: CHAT domain-containing protein [Pseudonocardiaceae bacterium]
MTTLDFELQIGLGAAGRYPVLARAPGGEADSNMRWSLTPAELDYQLAVIKDKVLLSSVVMRRAPTEYEQPVRELGQRLFDELIADDVRALYVASRQRARANDCLLRLVLRVRPPELARLPWEFLFDPGQQDYLGLTVPLVRYPHVLAPRQPLRVATPLRILGMVARPGDQHTLDTGQEQQRLQAALASLRREGLVELEWVAGQTYRDLEDALDRGPWHVFHFVGHGGYDRAADEGILALADEAGRTHPVGADDISRLLAEHHPLRLVVLNACDTGHGSASDPFSSTAAALIRREIPAVVAMQFEITDSAAIRFAQTFYQYVAKGRPVDDSVMRARRALRLAKKDTLEWGTPVLYLRAPDGRIFDTTIPPPPQPVPSHNPDLAPIPEWHATPPTPAHGDIIELRLTPQELSVCLAVQRGRTNAGAAAELSLSVKTIEYHLSNIYRKLGISSRTQLIRVLETTKVLILEDVETRVQVVLEADLPAAAYQALVALDLSTFQQGPVRYDRQRAEWRSELDE